MEVYHRSGNEETGADIETTTINTSAGYLALNICNLLDVFTTLGVSSLHIRTDDKAWDSILLRTESALAFDTVFSWSIGARATLWQCDCFTIGIEGQYLGFDPHLNYFLLYSNGGLTYFKDAPRATYREWQGGIGLAYRFATSCPTLAMVPYAAVKWAGARLNMNDVEFITSSTQFTLNDLKAKKVWGYAVGVSFTLCTMAGVTVEGRWADEKAVYVNGQMSF